MESSHIKEPTTPLPSIMKSLFCGALESSLASPYPSMSQEERDTVQMMIDSIREFYKRHVNSRQIDKDAFIPDEVLLAMKHLGLFGLSIPLEYGGLGLSTIGYAKVMEEIGRLDSSLAVTLGAHHSIGLKGLLLYGTNDQKTKYLPKLAKGEMIAAFALTEASAGSDAGGLLTKAELSADGKNYLLQGNKIWISNGGIADLFTVFARTPEADTKEGKPKITAFLVERAHGVRSGPSEHKLGIRGSSTNTLYFEDTRVPIENILGEFGQGFKVAMKILNSGRLGLAAITVGGCRALIELAIKHTKERKAFGRFIGQFDLIKDKISRMVADTYALESMTYLTASLVDRGQVDYSIESAVCKVYGSETVWQVANETLQIAAGIGYMQEYPYERLLRDCRIAMIFEGTNEILRSFITLTGLRKPVKDVAEVSKCISHPITHRGLLVRFAWQKIRAWTQQESFPFVHSDLFSTNRVLAKGIRIFSMHVDRALNQYGNAIVENQFIQLRLANIAIDLYGLIATISRTQQLIEQKGAHAVKREIGLCRMFSLSVEKRLSSVQYREEISHAHQRQVAELAYADGIYESQPI